MIKKNSPKPKYLRLAFIIILSGLLLAACDLFQTGPASIDELTLSRSINSEYKATDPTTVFNSTDSTIYAVVKASNLPDGTKLSSRWYYNGDEIQEVRGNLYISGNRSSGYVSFSIVPAVGEPFSTGNWKVEVYLNDTLAKTASFTIQ